MGVKMLLLFTILSIVFDSCSPIDIKQMYGTKVSMSNTMLHYKLYQGVAMKYGGMNAVYSPYMITYMLAMLSSATDGKSYDQIADLTMAPSSGSFRMGNKAIYEIIKENRGDPANIDFSSAIWYHTMVDIEESYVSLVKSFSDILLFNESIYTSVDDKSYAINKMIALRSNERFSNLFPDGSISIDDKLVYANGFYFKPDLGSTFESTTIDFMDKKNNIKMVSAIEGIVNCTIAKYEEEGIVIMKAPIMNDKFGLILITSRIPGRLDTFLANLTMEKASEMLRAAGQHKPQVIRVPTFYVKTSFDVAPVLISLNMSDVFDKDNADLSIMTNSAGAYISSMEQTSIIDITNEGATGKTIDKTGFDVTTFDRPFAFYLIEPNFKAILMAGKLETSPYPVYVDRATAAPSSGSDGENANTVEPKSGEPIPAPINLKSVGSGGIEVFISFLTIVCPVFSMFTF